MIKNVRLSLYLITNLKIFMASCSMKPAHLNVCSKESGPIFETACVIIINDASFDVLLANLGQMRRVYIDVRIKLMH